MIRSGGLKLTELLGKLPEGRDRMAIRNLAWRRFRDLACACGILAIAAIPVIAQPVQIRETGSTLLLPLFNLWIQGYLAANPDVAITTDATGSGAGINAAISGAAEIGASDAYMSDEQAEQNPQIVNIPLAIAAQTVNYNIPEAWREPTETRRTGHRGHLLGKNPRMGCRTHQSS